MKKLKLLMFALLAIGESVVAQTVTVSDVEAVPGETVSFSVNLLEGKADTYTAMTIYAKFPTTGFTTTGAYTISSLWTGATAIVGEVDDTGLATIPLASSDAIPGTSVDNLVTVSFTVDAGVALGSYNVTLQGTMFEYGTSDKDYASDVTFQVHVVSTHTVVLNESSMTAPDAASNVNVRVMRTIAANEWSTICLPFAMTEVQVKAAFGDDVELGDFNGYDMADDGNSINVKFNSVTAIEANHPYIIKVGEAVTEFTVYGVDVAPEDEPTINKGTNRKPKAFIGNYVAGTAVDNGCLFLNGNKFWYSVGTTKIKAFRAYFNFFDLLPDFEDNYAEAPVFIMFGNETTGLTEVDSLKLNGEKVLYNLNGQRVSTLAKGVYIKNGKKVAIK